MPGLLEFLNTPAGLGLLSGVAGYAAGARRGTPVNNVGRGLVTGLSGYADAQQQLRADSENALTQQFRQMQMDQMAQTIADAKARRDAAAGAMQDVSKPTQYAVGGQTFSDPQQAQLSAANMFSLPSDAVPSFGGAPAPLMGQPQPGIADFSGGQPAPVTEQKAPDVRTAMFNRLMKAGQIDEAMKYAPKEAKWTLGERYNEKTGMPEKVLYDANNPTNTLPFGGAQADQVIADNIGGQLRYRGQHSVTPLGVVQKTVSPDALLTDQRTRSEGALNRGVTLRGQKLADARATQTIAQGNKPPAGYRYKPNGDLEMIPGGPADIKNQQKMEGGGTVTNVVASLRDAYDQLDEANAVTSTQNRAGTNFGAWASNTGLGQTVGGMLGTKNQAMRDQIAQQRPILLQAIMKATGMSSKQMDSNAELKLYLATATDPTKSVQANRKALDMIEKLYGSGAGNASITNPSNSLPGGWTVKEH